MSILQDLTFNEKIEKIVKVEKEILRCSVFSVVSFLVFFKILREVGERVISTNNANKLSSKFQMAKQKAINMTTLKSLRSEGNFECDTTTDNNPKRARWI